MRWLGVVVALWSGAALGQQAVESLDDAIRRLMAEPVPGRVPLATVAREAAVLRGLDAFSGQGASLTVPVDGTGQFERITVRVLACHEVDDGQDAYAFVEMVDTKMPDVVIFRGWLIASNPALSALDHPRFDVWLQSCSTSSG
jgi:hypothetical protein